MGCMAFRNRNTKASRIFDLFPLEPETWNLERIDFGGFVFCSFSFLGIGRWARWWVEGHIAMKLLRPEGNLLVDG